MNSENVLGKEVKHKRLVSCNKYWSSFGSNRNVLELAVVVVTKV